MKTNSENVYVSKSKFEPVVFKFLILCMLLEEIIRIILSLKMV